MASKSVQNIDSLREHYYSLYPGLRLLPRRRRFALYKANGHTGKDAADLADYKKSNLKNTATHLLNQMSVRKEIQHIMSTAAEKLGIDETFVLSGVKEFTGHADPKIALDAFKTLGKHLKLFNDLKLTHEFTKQDDFVLKELSKHVLNENDEAFELKE